MEVNAGGLKPWLWGLRVPSRLSVHPGPTYLDWSICVLRSHSCHPAQFLLQTLALPSRLSSLAHPSTSRTQGLLDVHTLLLVLPGYLLCFLGLWSGLSVSFTFVCTNRPASVTGVLLTACTTVARHQKKVGHDSAHGISERASE